MTWTKLSDDFADDAWGLSDAAVRLHLEGLLWSNRKLLDCRVPKEEIQRHAKRPEAVRELLDTGFWAEDGDYYVIRHHAKYQRTRAAVLAQQAVNAANGSKGGRPKTESRTKPKSESQSEAITERSNSRTGARGAKNPGIMREETESLTESLTDSKTERDGTGLRRGEVRNSRSESAWTDGVSPESVCSVPGCGGAVTDWLRGNFGQYCMAHAADQSVNSPELNHDPHQ
ncbi:hypothetical protein [Sinomonas gamaensis]|uniref:hypothetical protein n=1 Tax=Sinomonas gamaensis TaxID=2565624 RepID=UPI001109FBF7|nr:hypothetical protein [Sinomonas gamaensis]